MESKINKDLNSSRLLSVKCYKCKSTRQARDTIKCLKCKKIFDFHCIGLTEKLYRLMQPEKRKMWKCNQCSSNQKEFKPTSSSHKEDKNVTLRKKTAGIAKQTEPTTPRAESPADTVSPVLDTQKINSEEEYEELDEFDESNYTKLDMLSKSEDFSYIKICEMQEMKTEIKELKVNLLSTQNELENILIENNQYKREINKLKKEIGVLKGSVNLLYLIEPLR